MIIQWPVLSAAVVLLGAFVPVQGSLRRLMMEAHSGSARIQDLLTNPWNWVDFLRAGVGVALLDLAITAPPEVAGAGMRVLLLKLAIVGAGLLLQILKWKETIHFFAPILYLSGLTLVFPGYLEGGFAVFVGWLTAIMGRKVTYQLPTMGAALFIAGYVLAGGFPRIELLATTSLIYVPWLLSTLFQRDLLLAPRSGQAK